jgi:hypothetical protein
VSRWSLRSFVAALALKALLDRVSTAPEPARPRRGRDRRAGATAARGDTDATSQATLAGSGPPPQARRGLLALMLGSAVVGVPMMILFEAPVPRVAGVLLLFTFIVSGVFLIADPAFLAAGDDADR